MIDRFKTHIGLLGSLVALPALATPPIPALASPETPPTITEPHPVAKPGPRFTTTVQIAVREKSPELTARGQRLVVEQLNQVFRDWPEFHGHPFRSTQSGKEVVFYVSSPEDMRQPMERAMAHMIGTLDGRVRVRGRSQFYRTSLEQPMEGMLEVVTDNHHEHILGISAQSVPLRDILKEIRHQVGGFSYLIPGNCAKQVVDWNYGDEVGGEAKTLDMAMQELGTLFKLKLEKQNQTFIFRGECQTPPARTLRRASLGSPPELLQSHLWADLPDAPRPKTPRAGGPRTTEVLFPLVPLN